MARKRLSDLLREEVQKPTEAPELEPVETEVKEEKEAIATDEHSLELEAAQQREAELTQQVADLNQQITDLKTEAKTQATTTQKLQASLEDAAQRHHQLETELTETKQAALQLADSNAQLKQQLEALKQSQPLKPTAPVAKFAPATTPKSDDTKLASKPLSQQEVLRRRQSESLAHPMFPNGKAPGQFSDQDLGWFD